MVQPVVGARCKQRNVKRMLGITFSLHIPGLNSSRDAFAEKMFGISNHYVATILVYESKASADSKLTNGLMSILNLDILKK